MSPEHLKKIRDQLGSARASVINWVKNAFFLWHRRKSHIEEAQAVGNFDSLDSEAEHLASRLNAILAGKNAVSVASKINDFMNAVIPGLGSVFIERNTKSDDRGVPQETLLSAKFYSGVDAYGLDSLGGGVEQVLAIALVLLAEDNSSALFIEEPEAHLHELAQRRLVEQIEEHRGERQIFIATHSPVFMNAFQDACIYQVTRDAEGKGQVKKCVDLRGQRAALDDVGVLPSTLLQTNCVVWVEGPTEVVLVEHWLSIVAPELKVHQHFELALTGGSNLTHYDTDTDAPSLMDLLNICRHNFLLADRDAAPGEEPAKSPVQGLQAKLGEAHCWITWGHEIEWYYPSAAVREKWKMTKPLDSPGTGAFYPKLAKSADRAKTAADRKPENARAIVKWAKGQPDPSTAWFGDERGNDLKDNLKRLVDFIRQANGLAAPGTDSCSECKRPL